MNLSRRHLFALGAAAAVVPMLPAMPAIDPVVVIHVPAEIASFPPVATDWTAAQVVQFKAWFDGVLDGSTISSPHKGVADHFHIQNRAYWDTKTALTEAPTSA